MADDVMTDVILLGHGSHRTLDTDQGLREVHRRLRALLADEARVHLAFFEFLHPTLAETVGVVAARRARRAVLMPYFLFEGREIQRDIPAELAHLHEQHPDLTVTMAATLGTHPNLIAVAADRVRAALDSVEAISGSPPLTGEGLGERSPSGSPPLAGEGLGERFGSPSPAAAGEGAGGVGFGVVLVNRGVRRQYDDGSRLAELCRLLQARLSETLGADTLVVPALAENSPQTVEAAAAELIEQGARSIVVLPYLHFPGKVLLESVEPATARARAAHPGIPIALAATLGVDDRIVAVCAERIRAALTQMAAAG